ncbi:hypothetical protein DL546_002535 [Coniochaeta pulveracea]|uniref:Uncharacterized protein n=1 Tax=Coniochaeta pulveracea TaxID=177199 RepID=A0A420YFS3_9PEZI|nr:hypothetical protein DL546_002535 [Coniochaeta pulveracea]
MATALAVAASPIAERPILSENPSPLISSTHPHPHPTATCTTTLTQYLSGFRGHFQPSIALTVYIHTHISVTQVDCSGCALAVTTELGHPYGGLGPEEIVTATVTATEPTTIVSTVCARPTNGGSFSGVDIEPNLSKRRDVTSDERMVDQGKGEAVVQGRGVLGARVREAFAVTTPPPRPTRSVTSTRTSTITLG